MELQLISAVLLAALLLTGGLISYVGRRDRGADPASGPAPGSSGESHRRRADIDYPAPRPGTGQRTASLPTDSKTRQAHDAPGLHPTVVAAPLGPGQSGNEDDGVLATRQALAANQAAMSDPRVSTLDRVQALMSSPAFALHLQGLGLEQAGVPPGGPTEDDKRDPRGKREPLEPS